MSGCSEGADGVSRLAAGDTATGKAAPGGLPKPDWLEGLKIGT